MLPDAERARLLTLWNAARRGHEERYCVGLGRAPATDAGAVSCLGFADLPAIAGDHSCTPEELYLEGTGENWLKDVLEVGNITERRIRDARSESARINAWSRSNLLLERADKNYALRAVSNAGHFVPTASPNETLETYLREAVRADEPLNAAGLFVVFHLSALRFAAAYADGKASGDGKSEDWARLALWSEAFALHFLEDSFSSGHNVGTWGGAALMKGTHDAYSMQGLPARSWSGEEYSAFGDAHLTSEDSRRTSRAVATSLSELTRVLTDGAYRAQIKRSWHIENALWGFRFDTCTATELGLTVPELTAHRFARSVWEQTIHPMPGEDDAHMPRFRSEIGPYVAFGAGASVASTWGGYFTNDAAARGSGDILVFAGLGIGLEGAIGIASDGLIEVGIGSVGSSSQYEPGCSDCGVDEGGLTHSRVPERSGLLFHYRAPYWLIPGDLLLVAPLLLALDFHLYKGMAIVSANGGVLGLQQIFLTPLGTFQFMLGRELNLTLFNGDDPLLRFNGGDPDAVASYSLFQVNSFKFDVPVVSYQPFRAFSNKLTSGLVLQLGGAIDVPRATEVRTGDEVSPGLAYSAYLRLVLESRWYLGAAAP